MELGVLVERMRHVRPRNRRELAVYCDVFCGMRVPGKKICTNHDSPLDYLSESFLEVGVKNDLLVWANRGGGKTRLGAVASLLDCLFNANCDVRILGGSLYQSQQMYGYLREMAANGFANAFAGRVTAGGCRFVNGSTVKVLTQSQSSVRGNHVQRLRCDEVELFGDDVWQAAQFVPQSRDGMAGRLEAMSTMHMPYGLMNDLVDGAGSGNGFKMFRWCLMEVLEKCEGRSCSQCYLYEDCKGRAKECDGYFSIDDAISQKRRGSKRGWQSEMMCLKPGASDQVFDEFDVDRNVCKVGYDAGAELYRSFDFGYSNPLVCLLIQVKGDVVCVLDEHVMVRKTIAEHAAMIKKKWRWPVAGNYCDPAGKQVNDVTGSSVVEELAGYGIRCECRASRILEGIEMVRSFVLSGDDRVRLLIDPKCKRLVKAMQMLRYKKVDGCVSELPEKDGENDHLIDALRYFFVNRYGRKYKMSVVKY